MHSGCLVIPLQLVEVLKRAPVPRVRCTRPGLVDGLAGPVARLDMPCEVGIPPSRRTKRAVLPRIELVLHVHGASLPCLVDDVGLLYKVARVYIAVLC